MNNIKYEIFNIVDIKNIINKYKLYNYTGHDNWKKIMNNPIINIKVRRKLYRQRMFLLDDIIYNLFKLINHNCLIIYPTGSKKLTSDYDIQIMYNLDCKDKYLYKITINNIIKTINNYISYFNNKRIFNILDINFYPGTLINYSNNYITNNRYLLVSDKKFNNVYYTIFIPQITNKNELDNFLENEKNNLKKKKNTDLKNFYLKYKKNIITCLTAIVDNIYKNKINKVNNQKYNKLLNCLVSYNNIGPEMYRTVSSIIIVVWHLQLKNKLPSNLLYYFSFYCYKENLYLYNYTKKLKYKKRFDYCYNIIKSYHSKVLSADPVLFLNQIVPSIKKKLRLRYTKKNKKLTQKKN